MNDTIIVLNSSSLKSSDILDMSRRVNIGAILAVALIGLIGHSLIILVFGQKRFRTNTSNVFLLCLAINDSLFLVIHVFEDTIRTYRDVFINETNSHYFINLLVMELDLTDKHELACILVNYFRYVLRFVSSYIQVAFTLQRLSIVFSPLNNRLKSKKSAWITCFLIYLASMILNMWAIFLFELQTDGFSNYCDIRKEWSNEYFQITAAYIILVVLIPILTIFTSNSLIIVSLIRAESSRKKLNKTKLKYKTEQASVPKISFNRVSKSIPQTKGATSGKKCGKNLSVSHALYQTSDLTPSSKLKPFYSSINNVANRSMSKSSTSTKNSTKILMLISFVFICLNLPYLVIWFVFYYQMAFSQVNLETKDYLFALLQICEVFYMLNYSVLFYVYCASGSKFRNQLKYSCKFYMFYFFNLKLAFGVNFFFRFLVNIGKKNVPKVEFYIENISNSKFI